MFAFLQLLQMCIFGTVNSISNNWLLLKGEKKSTYFERMSGLFCGRTSWCKCCPLDHKSPVPLSQLDSFLLPVTAENTPKLYFFSAYFLLGTQPKCCSGSAVKIQTSLQAAGDWRIAYPSRLNSVLILSYLSQLTFYPVLYYSLSFFLPTALSDVTTAKLSIHISSYYTALWLLLGPPLNLS